MANVNVVQNINCMGLTENERRLLSAAELGDGDLVRKLLESGEVSAEVLDSQGRSALDLAIIGEGILKTWRNPPELIS
jgi:ankyrin repeat protein